MKNTALTLTLLTLVCTLCLAPAARAVEPVTPDASPEAKALLNFVYAMYGEKILSGQMWAPWGRDAEAMKKAYLRENLLTRDELPDIMSYMEGPETGDPPKDGED